MCEEKLNVDTETSDIENEILENETQDMVVQDDITMSQDVLIKATDEYVESQKLPKCMHCGNETSNVIKLKTKKGYKFLNVCDKCADKNYRSMHLPVRVERTPGRNERCGCGSGQKFKKCCGSKIM